MRSVLTGWGSRYTRYAWLWSKGSDHDGIRVRLPRRVVAHLRALLCCSFSTVSPAVVCVQCPVKDAESLSSDNPKTNRLITRIFFHTIPRPRVASRANEQVPNISLLPLRPSDIHVRLAILVSPAGTWSQHILSPPRSRKPHPSSLCLPRRQIMRAKKSAVRAFSCTQANFSRFKPSTAQTILARSRGCCGAW